MNFSIFINWHIHSNQPSIGQNFWTLGAKSDRGLHIEQHFTLPDPPGSISAQALIYSSRWWAPRMDESLVK
ncbi:hypothetical protein BpHYR1_031830 [Brachionus plicatilis]|uniref:Uncharacterized protein n=1 Tax=Brachionus plicatilis TaxID=10195 RepID=A0A3M7SY71_BRAPC|nr:hypothetical protein BpHYR1_031830 [Brachionus plicatilis]